MGDKPSHEYQLVFLNSLREGADYSSSLKSLQRLANLNLRELHFLRNNAPCKIKNLTSQVESKALIKRLWAIGWHTKLYRNGQLIYSTLEKRLSSQDKSSQADLFKSVERESLEFPGNWQCMEGLNSKASIQAGCPEINAYAISIAQSKLAFKNIPTHSHYSKVVVNNVCRDISGVFIDDFCRLIKIDKSQKDVYLSELFVETSNLSYLIAVFEGRQAFYSLYFWCAKTEYVNLKQVFLQIVESFDLGYSSKRLVA